jgi:signal transduction histidine kinase
MYERASLMNARLAILSRPGMGTTVSLRIPIESPA